MRPLHGELICKMHLRRIGLACLAILSLGRIAVAQTVSFDTPLSVTMVELPLNHPPVEFACAQSTGHVMEVRYWQKNPADDGFVDLKSWPGQVVPPCDKVMSPQHTPLFVRCSVYAGFTVKERRYENEQGDDGIAIVPKQHGPGAFPCDDQVAPGEFLLKPALFSEWFTGVVGRYVFVNADDIDNFGWDPTNIFSADAPGPIGRPSVLWDDDQTIRLTRMPGGFDLRFMAYVSLHCSLDGAKGAVCLARLERAAGADISRAQCLKAVPKAYLKNPVALVYPAHLSVQGSKAVLRAIGPGVGCVASD